MNQEHNSDKVDLDIYPLVTWLMCAHIGNEYLKIAIESCLEQTYKNYELIIVLNGPHRDEIERSIIGWFPLIDKVRIYKSPIQHLIFSLNLGLHFARGKYIARMDSDDISHPQRLELQVICMEANPKIAVLGSAYKVVDELGTKIGFVRNPLSNKSIRRQLFFKNPLCHPSVMMRKSCVLNIGGYMGGLHAEDYDLWCRLSIDSLNHFKNLDDELLSYRFSSAGGARKSRRAYATMAATQLNVFFLTGKLVWIIAIILTYVKAVWLSKRP